MAIESEDMTGGKYNSVDEPEVNKTIGWAAAAGAPDDEADYAVEGNFYLNKTTSEFFQFVGGDWVSQGSFTGILSGTKADVLGAPVAADATYTVDIPVVGAATTGLVVCDFPAALGPLLKGPPACLVNVAGNCRIIFTAAATIATATRTFHVRYIP